MKSVTLIFAALLSSAPAFAQTKVFVFTQPSEFVDADSKQRTDTVEDLRKELAKKKTLAVVATKDGAQVVLEVLKRGAELTGERTGSSVREPLTGRVLSSSNAVGTKAITVALSVGTYSTELKATNDQIVGAWTAMAKNVTRQVEKWVKDNAAALAGTAK